MVVLIFSRGTETKVSKVVNCFIATLAKTMDGIIRRIHALATETLGKISVASTRMRLIISQSLVFRIALGLP